LDLGVERGLLRHDIGRWGVASDQSVT
jgi:hypothetical protein